MFLQHMLVSYPVFRIFVGSGALWLRGFAAEFGSMVDGTACRPYVLRALIPTTIRTIRDSLPADFKYRLACFLGTKEWFPEYLHSSRAIEFAIALPILFLLFLGYSINLRRLARSFYPGDASVDNIAMLIGTMLVTLCSAYGHFIYDPGTLFFFSLCLVYVVEDRLIPLLIAFTLLAVQKETALLLIPVFALRHVSNLKSVRTIGGIVGMGTLWLVIRSLITNVYADNPGSLTEAHFFEHNLRLNVNPIATGFFIVTVFFVGGLVVYDWKSKDLFLRRGLLLLVVPIFILTIFFGFVDEIRVYYEALPFVALLIAPTVSTYST